MIRGFYAAASGLISQQTNLNTIANNVANISTTGFKPQQASFLSLLYANLNGGDGNTISSGHGVKVEKTGIDFTQGNLIKTDREMDMAILGDGFFAIENREDGTVTYTRDGTFQIGMEDDDPYLVNASGNYVLDRDGDRIELEDGFDPAEVGVFVFENKYGLLLVGGNQFAVTESSGEAEEMEEPNVKTGYLEGSRVQIAQEMVKMIEASKGFSFNSRIVQATDEMEKMTNQLR
ncbi:flagellar hook-basal body protein [Sinanaerobacter chloroacetimidivorans]|uniref:Flagellar hook-basal body protein n=1 Tax=Sinanaerobacter chloroacetimidivorans TaxID=2818044 RepID=A0A8J8B1D6_9FIRM|nr:flagellar hook-basal body protein [Sinanaerobacter chloroacetimidivorans]MBR0597551.1 flagellar hook-basal body protein [Sinanaerobacter chloroacetimidivorans]